MPQLSLFKGEYIPDDPEVVAAGYSRSEKAALCHTMAQDLVHLWELDAAERFLRHALKWAEPRDPIWLDLHQSLGLVHLRRGEWAAAKASYDHAIELGKVKEHSDLPRLICGRATQSIMVGNWKEAEQLLRSAISMERPGIGRYCAEVNLLMLLSQQGYRDEVLRRQNEVRSRLVNLDDDTGYLYLMSHMAFNYAVIGDHDRYQACLNVLEPKLVRPGLVSVKIDVFDTRVWYATKRQHLDEATTLLEQWRRECTPEKYTRWKGWYGLRRAAWLRAAGESRGAILEIRQVLASTGIEAVLAARLFAELANAADQSGDARTVGWARSRARRGLRRLGVSVGEIRDIVAAREGARRVFRSSGSSSLPLSEFRGEADCIQKIRAMLVKLGHYPSTILLYGESGTGKTLLARVVHESRGRATGSFIRFDCTCNDEGLVESLLFGHQKGAFTGAVDSRKGLVELAAGGTLFIDEVGDLPLALQGKLLTLLEEGTYRPVGGTATRRADVRFIVATNRDLAREVAERRFREDLYFRLGDLRVELPPLREHAEDIPELVRAFLSDLNSRHRQRKTIGLETLRVLQEQPWPGNTRQLKKVVERGYLLSDGTAITVADMGLERAGETRPLKTLEAVEREHINRILGLVAGNKSEAARLLGVKRTTLYSRMQSLGLQ